MSSSPTETLVDVTMPQMGVSVAEGTVVEWKKQPGDWVERDEIIASISTDKIDTDVEAPATGRVQEILVEVGTTVDVGVVMARIATDAKPGEAHVSESESASRRARRRPTVALEAPGEAGELSGDTTETHAGTAQRGTPEVRRSGPRRYSPVVMRIAAEHGIDLEQVEGTGRGGRVRKQDVLALPRVERRRSDRAADAHREPVQAASRSRRAKRGRRRPAGGQPLSRMRQSIGERDGRLAADRGDLHDDRRGRHDPDRGAPREDRPDLPALRGARDDRDAARVPRRSTRRSRARRSRSTTACTSASPSRSARAG